VQDLPTYLHKGSVESSPASAGSLHAGDSSTAASSGTGSLEEQERLLIIRALQTAAGNQSEAARILRIGRDALRYKLKKHRL
jgi:DNA-binding NtrC family response regulator